MIEVSGSLAGVPILGLALGILILFPGSPGSPGSPSPPEAPAGRRRPAAGQPRGPQAALAALPAAAARALMALMPLVERVLRRCRVPEGDVPDVAQDVLLRLVPWWSQRTPEEQASLVGPLRSYVCVVAQNGARRFRSRTRRVVLLGAEDDVVEDGLCPWDGEAVAPSPEDRWLEQEAALEQAEELHRLSHATTPERWRAIRAYVLEGQTVREIACAERAVPATIYNRIALARRDLRAAVRRRRAAEARAG
jgi:DNA-directed RNA polymerase specialized sigma24 family protein